MTYVHDMTVRNIYDVPTLWLEQSLAVMALAPDTRNDKPSEIGMPCGLQRPEFGPNIHDLQCVTCEATWCGVPGDPCWWCERATQRQIDHQIDLLLAVPDIDPDDDNYELRMDSWADRMVVGVEAGLITQQQADTAWHRAARKSVA